MLNTGPVRAIRFVTRAFVVAFFLGRQLAPELDIMTEAAPFFAQIDVGASIVDNSAC